MNTNQPASQWMHLKERLVTTLVGLIPRITLGAKLRNLLYRTILKRLGSSVFIQVGAEFIGTSGIEIGDGVHIYRDVRLYSEGSNSKICIRDRVYLDRGVTIGSGENCCIEICEDAHISAYTCIYGPAQVKIGKDCAIGEHSGICANNRNFADVTRKIRDQGLTCKGIVIEDDCWLGHAVTVLDGVTIGQGSVIGAGAVVTKDIPPYSVAVGVPARVIRSRMPSKIESECLPIDKPLPLV